MTVKKVSTSGTSGIGAGTRGSAEFVVVLCAHRACAWSPVMGAVVDAVEADGRSRSPKADCNRRDFIGVVWSKNGCQHPSCRF